MTYWSITWFLYRKWFITYNFFEKNNAKVLNQLRWNKNLKKVNTFIEKTRGGENSSGLKKRAWSVVIRMRIVDQLSWRWHQRGPKSGNNPVFSVREINLQSIKVKTWQIKRWLGLGFGLGLGLRFILKHGIITQNPPFFRLQVLSTSRFSSNIIAQCLIHYSAEASQTLKFQSSRRSPLARSQNWYSCPSLPENCLKNFSLCGGEWWYAIRLYSGWFSFKNRTFSRARQLL